MDSPELKKGLTTLAKPFFFWWEHTGSNRGPSACKADALNQLSYAPLFGSANIVEEGYSKKFKVEFYTKILMIPFIFYINDHFTCLIISWQRIHCWHGKLSTNCYAKGNYEPHLEISIVQNIRVGPLASQ